MKPYTSLYISDQVKCNPSKEFIRDSKTSYTYLQFESAISKLCLHINKNHNVSKGERALLVLPNITDFYLSFFALLELGIIAVPIPVGASKKRLEYIIQDCKPAIILSTKNNKSISKLPSSYIEIPDFHQQSGNTITIAKSIFSKNKYSVFSQKIIDVDPAMIIYTSGSTGTPKGIVCSHLNIHTAATSICQYLGMNEEDKILSFLPPSFDYGLYQSILTARSGASLVLQNNGIYIDKTIELANEHSITGLPIVPTFAASLISSIESNEVNISTHLSKSLRFLTSTGAPISSYILSLQKKFPSTNIFSMYGLTECKRVSYLPPYQVSAKPTSVGIPMPNVNIKIVNDNKEEVSVGETGTLIIKGSNIALGYWNEPVLNETTFYIDENGNRFLNTGDSFKQDHEGYLYFVGRKDGIIKIGSNRVSIIEVESLISSIEEVHEAAIVSALNEHLQHEMYAFVVPKPYTKITSKNLKSKLRKLVEGSYMIPKSIQLLSSLPKNHNRKVSLSELKKMIDTDQ